jgi:hypothetical protein
MWKLPNSEPDYYLTVDPDYTPTDPDAFIVGSSASSMGSDSDHIVMTFDNLFPLDKVPVDGPPTGLQFAWRANFVIHYDGSVPAIVDAKFTNAWGDAQWLWDNGYVWVVFERLHSDYTGDPAQNPWNFGTGQYITEPIQVEGCEYFLCWMCIEIPQDPMDPVYAPPQDIPQEAFMNLVGGFEAEITAIQWNEYQP